MSTWTELKAMTRGLLEHPERFEWTLQGFGMLRAHISDECRLNVWDNRFAIPEYREMSSIHTHPWNFTSTVVLGGLIDRTYTAEPWPSLEESDGLCVDITPGIGGGARSAPYPVRIRQIDQQWLIAGESYALDANTFHTSQPGLGAVTINTRQRVGDDVAKVAWYGNHEWVSAEPRPATDEEIKAIIDNALSYGF